MKMFRCRSAASAKVGYADISKFCCLFGKVFSREREECFPIFQYRHSCIWLDDDGLIGCFNHFLCDIEEFVRPERAVGSNDISTHGIKKNGGGFRRSACNGSSVFRIRHLADDRKI